MHSLLSVPIIIFNPHSEVLRVTEIYTSGGFSYISLPNSPLSPQKADDLWDIEPNCSKSIITLHFCASNVGVYHGFLNIITEGSQMSILIDMVIVKEGVHLIPEELHFGSIPENTSKSLELYLLNADDEELSSDQIIISVPNESIRVDKIETNLPPKMKTKIADVTYYGSHPGQYAGNLNLILRQNTSINIPCSLKVMKGQLLYQVDMTYFTTVLNDDSRPLERQLTFKNDFNEDLLLLAANSTSDVIKIIDYTPGLATIGSEWAPLYIEINPIDDCDGSHELLLFTNASTISVPFMCFNGKLIFYRTTLVDHMSRELLNGSQIDLKYLPSGKPFTYLLVIHNPNYFIVPVSLKSRNLWIDVELLDKSGLPLLCYGQNYFESVEIPPFDFILTSITITGKDKGAANGIIDIDTPFETKQFSLMYSILDGNIAHDNTTLEIKCPENRDMLALSNSYSKDVEIKDILLEDGFKFESLNKNLPANSKTMVGYISYNGTCPDADVLHSTEMESRSIRAIVKTSIPSEEQLELSIRVPRINLCSIHILDYGRCDLEMKSEQYMTVFNYNPMNIVFEVLNPEDIAPFSLPQDYPKKVHLSPNQEFHLGPISFEPKENDKVYKRVLCLKIQNSSPECIDLVGIGGIRKIEIREAGSKSVASNGSLFFEIEKRELERCFNDEEFDSIHLLQFKRDFYISNEGNIPVHILNMDSGKQRRFDFSLDEKRDFVIEPKEAKHFSISYTPDFTRFDDRGMLKVDTDLGTYHWEIQAHLPLEIANQCLKKYKVTIRQHSFITNKLFYLIAMAVVIMLLGICWSFNYHKKELESTTLDIVPIKSPKSRIPKKKKKRSKCLGRMFSKEEDSSSKIANDDDELVLFNNPFYVDSCGASPIDAPSKNITEKTKTPSECLMGTKKQDKDATFDLGKTPVSKKSNGFERPFKRHVEKRRSISLNPLHSTTTKPKFKPMNKQKKKLAPPYKPTETMPKYNKKTQPTSKMIYGSMVDDIVESSYEELSTVGVIGSGLEKSPREASNHFDPFSSNTSEYNIMYNKPYIQPTEMDHYNPLFSLPPLASDSQENSFTFFEAPCQHPSSFENLDTLFDA